MNQKNVEEQLIIFFKEVLLFIQKAENNFTCNYEFDWSNKRVNSRGGMYKNGPKINLALAYEYPVFFPAQFIEYKSFAKHKEIGSFYYKEDNLLLGLKALICHELAHALLSYKKLSAVSHGIEWKSIYRIFRNQFINNQLNIYSKESESLKEVLNKLTNKNEDMFYTYCSDFGLNKKHYNQKFFYRKEIYKIIGINPRAKKYSIETEKIKDNRRFKFESNIVLAGLNDH